MGVKVNAMHKRRGIGEIGGVGAYRVATGRLVASYTRGEYYNAVFQLPNGVVLAVGSRSPQLSFFSPALRPAGSAETPLNVTAVF